MGNTSITAGGISAIVAGTVIGRKTDEMEPVAKPMEAIQAEGIMDRSAATQDVKEFKTTGEGSTLDLNRFATDHQNKVFQDAIKRGYDEKTAERLVRRDPIVFDLNSDGDTNATVRQRGIEVDGATNTNWAEQGDGVLAMGNSPIDTTDSRGGVHQDAYETLRTEAQLAGIDTTKGFLNLEDIKKLEGLGLTMMVSNGDGSNQMVKPTDLGITQISLGGKAVDKTDIVGNLITTEGSFVRNGKTELAQDMWFLDHDSQAANNTPNTTHNENAVRPTDHTTETPTVTTHDQNPTVTIENKQLPIDPELLEQIYRKRDAALKGEIDTTPIKVKSVKDLLKAAGIENPTDHNVEVFKNAISKGESPEQAVAKVKSDPLVFDLNGDGDTNATVDQHGIEVDGATSTKWAEQGDGVLAMGNSPIDTTDSKGVKHKDAFETLKAEAEIAGIDTSKGYLDTSDLKTLEAKGLTMMVSNGDGTNKSVKPTELGISKIPLGGKAVDKTDTAGNAISSEASFVRNGQEQRVNDMWFNQI